MAPSTDPMAGEQPAPARAGEQQQARDWPRPGEEGFVHPDGTPQAATQLADNRRAAADRAAAGSSIHGAPANTPGVNPGTATGVAARRGADYTGPSTQQARADLTAWVGNKRQEVATDADAAADTGTQAKRARA